jgi:mRNA-degrading endonuclease RelE of RelBE toxin-antitoxin system
MRYELTPSARKDYQSLEPRLLALFEKQLSFLLADLRHPSLRAKKYDLKRNIWQARVDRSCRFYFQIRGDTYVILRIIPHPK